MLMIIVDFIFYVTYMGKQAIENRLLNLQLIELLQALSIVNSHFGFDINWLIGLSLIQFHKNLLKRKLSELGEKVSKNEKCLASCQDWLSICKSNYSYLEKFTGFH